MMRRSLAVLVPAACLLGALPLAGPRRGASAAGDSLATAPTAANAGPASPATGAGGAADSTEIPRDLALLVAQLGDDDPQTRDAASRRLSAMGRAALPALRAAAGGDDPEVAGRARRLIADFRFGIGVDTPADLLELVNQYRTGQPNQRQQAVQRLAGWNWAGYRVLAKLRRQETDPAWREVLAEPLHAGAQTVVDKARESIVGGSEDEAETILAEAAEGGDGDVSRSYAALLLARGKLDRAMHDLEAEAADSPSPDDALLLAWMARAKGDADAVLRYANLAGRQPGYPWGMADELKREVWLDRHDWPRLLELVERKLKELDAENDAAVGAAGPGGAAGAGPGINAAPRLNRALIHDPNSPAVRRTILAEKAAYARLGGQGKALDDAVAALRHEVEQTPTGAANYAIPLLLNERYADGLNLLRSGKEYLMAFQLLGAEGRHEEALRLVDSARTDGWERLPLLELATAESLASLGEKDRAAQVLDRVTKDFDAANANGGNANVVNGYVVEAELIRADLALGRNDQAFARAAAALDAPAYRNNPSAVLRMLLPNFADAALRWREFLERQHPGAPSAEVLAKVWALFSRKLPTGEAESLLRDATEHGTEPLLEAVADAARAAGREDLAESAFEKLAKTSAGWFPWKYLGDRAARRGDWDRAAECYGRAKEKGPAEPICLWLDGWARRQSGHGDAASAAQMGRADELLLADGNRWAGFVQAIADAGADATGDAEPQRQMLRRLNDPGSWSPTSWAYNESYHESARALLTAGKRLFEVEDPLEEQAGETPIDSAAGVPAGGASGASGAPGANAPVDPERAKRAREAEADRCLRSADLTERWLIPLASGRMVFNQPAAYLGQPAAVHIIRARGLIERGAPGDVAAALKEADLALAALPVDTQLPIDLVPALDRAGHKAEADALFRKVASATAVAIDRYPRCAEQRNGSAWMCAKCGRDLDKALENAEQATKLSPDTVAYLDTLAEVHFRRGERQAAIDTMKRCIELDPHFEYLQRQMKRFTAGAGEATTRPAR